MKTIEMRGKYGDGKFVIVDDWNFDWITQWKWHVDLRGYAVRNVWEIIEGKRISKTIQMHSLINKTPKNYDTDHINRDRLDNRESNLRTASKKENSRNCGKKSRKNKYKGVYRQSFSGRFVVMLSISKKNECWGTYDDEDFAAHVHDYVAFKNHGDFSYLNFPNEVPSEKYNPDFCRDIRYKNR